MNTATAMLDGLPAVRACINYIGEMGEEPYMYYREPPPNEPYTNIIDDPHAVDIVDLRVHRDRLAVESDGIQFIQHGHRFVDFEDDDRIRSTYYPVVEQMFREILGIEKVLAYDFSVRRPAHGPARPEGIPVAGTRRRPIRRAHGDFIRESFQRFVEQLGDGFGPQVSSGRCRAFNFWRPLRGPLTDAPLALCHPLSVDERDLVRMRQFNEPQDNYICALRYNPNHRWCYLSQMLADEGVIFSSFDNAYPEARGVVAHCAFDDPLHLAQDLPRESIEVRVLTFGE